MSLPEALERAAVELADDADAIRPANGDPIRLLECLDSEGAVRVLGWLLVNAPDAGEELALDWSEDDRGLAPLRQIEESALPKPGRKVLRKIWHRLRSSGVALEEPTRSAPKVARLPGIEDDIRAAYVTGLDPRGAVLVYIIEPHPSGGARLFQVILDEQRGVLDFRVFNAGRSKLRSFLKELIGDPGNRVAQTDPALARALVARISEQHPPHRPLPKAFSEWRLKLLEDAAGSTPGAVARQELAASSDERALERVAERVRDHSLGPWPGPSEVVEEVGGRIESQLAKFAELGEDERASELESALSSATGALFESDHARHTARRFEEHAYVLWRTGLEEEARDCLAAADSLEAGAGAGAGAENPVARALTEICYAPVLERLTGGAEEDPESES